MEQKFGKNSILCKQSGKAERLCITPNYLSTIRKSITFESKK